MNTGRIGKGYLSTEAAARQGGGLAPMLTLATLRPRYMLIGKWGVCVCVCATTAEADPSGSICYRYEGVGDQSAGRIQEGGAAIGLRRAFVCSARAPRPVDGSKGVYRPLGKSAAFDWLLTLYGLR
jgi:hypothetical protein